MTQQPTDQYTADTASVREPMSDLPFGTRAAARGLRFAGAAMIDLMLLLWLCVVVVLSCVGVGLPLLNPDRKSVV